MSETTYTTSAVCAAAGIPRATLWAWRNRGQFQIEAAEGAWTRYSLADLLRAVTIAELARYGIVPSAQGPRLIDEVVADLHDNREQYEHRHVDSFLLVTKASADNANWVTFSGMTGEQISDRLVRGFGGKTKLATIYIVINTARLWRRVADVLREYEKGGGDE